MPPKFKRIANGVTGEVLWFNRQDGHGKVHFENYGDVTVHHSRILSPVNESGNNFLLPSQIVTCDIICGPKGNQADNITVIYSKPIHRSSATSLPDRQQRTPSEHSSGSRAVSRRTEYNKSSGSVVENDLRGEVKSFDRSQRRGLVLIRQYGTIVCHSDNIVFSGLSTSERILCPTQIVKCDVSRDGKGVLYASNIHVISETSHTTTADDRPIGCSSRTSSQNLATQSNCDGDSAKDSGIIETDCLGEVEMYNPTKKFGFLHVHGYDNVYVRSFALMNASVLSPKQVVKCDITRGPKTFMALNVRILTGGAETSTSEAPTTKQNTKFTQEKPVSLLETQKHAPHLMASAPPVAPLPPPINLMHPYATPPLMGFNYGSIQPNQFLPPVQQFPVQNYLLENPPPYQSQDIPDLEKLKLSHQMHSNRNNDINEKKKKQSSRRQIARLNETGKKNKEKLDESKLLCEICEDALEDPVTVPCGHLFCRECINEWLAVNPSCPVDGKAISKKSVKSSSKISL